MPKAVPMAIRDPTMRAIGLLNIPASSIAVHVTCAMTQGLRDARPVARTAMIIKMISARKCCLHLLTLNDARRTVKSSYRICSIHLSRTGINSCTRTRTIEGRVRCPTLSTPTIAITVSVPFNETGRPSLPVQPQYWTSKNPRNVAFFATSVVKKITYYSYYTKEKQFSYYQCKLLLLVSQPVWLEA